MRIAYTAKGWIENVNNELAQAPARYTFCIDYIKSIPENDCTLTVKYLYALFFLKFLYIRKINDAQTMGKILLYYLDADIAILEKNVFYNITLFSENRFELDRLSFIKSEIITLINNGIIEESKL